MEKLADDLASRLEVALGCPWLLRLPCRIPYGTICHPHCRIVVPKWRQRLGRDYVRLLQQMNSTRTPLHDVRYLHHRYWIEH